MPTTSRRTTRLGILLAVVVAALTLGLSNAAWAQSTVSGLPDVLGDRLENSLAASDISILNDIYVCSIDVDVVDIPVSGAIGAYNPPRFCVIDD